MVAVKISILLLYHSIFPGRDMAIASLVIGALTILSGTAALLISIFTCVPVHAYWDVLIEKKCIDFNAWYLAGSVIIIVTDLAILCLPIYRVRRLKMGLRTKVGVIGMFLLGGL